MPDEVAPDYVRARWAYSELLSWGHGHLYQGLAHPAVAIRTVSEEIRPACRSVSDAVFGTPLMVHTGCLRLISCNARSPLCRRVL